MRPAIARGPDRLTRRERRGRKASVVIAPSDLTWNMASALQLWNNCGFGPSPSFDYGRLIRELKRPIARFTGLR